jgi:hypothetical protein
VIVYATAIGAVVVLINVSVIKAVAPLPTGLLIPTTTGRVQVNVAPAVALVIVYAWAVLLQIAAVEALVTVGVASTVTVYMNGIPTQPAAVDGVIVYATAIGAVVVLINVSVMDAVAPLPTGLLIPATTGRVQVNVAPGVALVIVYAWAVLLQIAAVEALVTVGVASTVTVYVNGVPTQPEAVDGVIVYATATGAVVVLINVSVMDAVAPLPTGLLIPATTGRVQVNVAPGVALVIVYAWAVLLQIAAVAALVTVGVASTVTVYVNGIPTQPAAVDGVIVYATAIGAVVVLINVSVMDAVAPLPTGLLIPATTGRVQVNVAPGVALVIVYAWAVLLQIAAVAALVTVGVASTVTV